MKLDEAVTKLRDTLRRLASIHGERRAARARVLAAQHLAARAYVEADEDLARKSAALFVAIDDYFAAKDRAEQWAVTLDELRNIGDASKRDAELAHRELFKTTIVYVFDRETGEPRAMPITFQRGDDDDACF